jgi:3',5'-cyclic AMP phosphodiesterase CpdA
MVSADGIQGRPSAGDADPEPNLMTEPHPAPRLVDPRKGDIEDDASSPEKRSMLVIAGSLLAEISLPKLVFSWLMMIGLPGLLLGSMPLLSSAWLSSVSASVRSALEWFPLVIAAALLWVGWLIGRPALRLAEESFWSLNAIAVQPGYALAREGLRHLAERLLGGRLTPDRRPRLNALTAAAGGAVACLFGLLVCATAWPYTRWSATPADLAAPLALLGPAIANAVVIVSAMMAGASLVWGAADATMDQPRDLEGFDTLRPENPVWRVVHLSDIHVVGERHGLRIESGRAGPSGNHRLERVLGRLADIHAREPLDLVLVTGDMTDAGRNAEWVEFELAFARHPALKAITLLLPGNHDVNIVDKANPARLDLPTSPLKRLRQMRSLAAIAAFQGSRVRVLSPDGKGLGEPLDARLAREAGRVRDFVDTGRISLIPSLGRLWHASFPMVLPPDSDDGLGAILLNSNAETHFSFTNALGLLSAEQVTGLKAVLASYPRARFVVALHHHLIEYPKPAKAFSERIGTALINGSWVVRMLKPFGARIVVLHGHRHIDWAGSCGPVRILSAPSPVMGGTDDRPTHFYIHRVQPGPEGRVMLLPPEMVEIEGDPIPA